MTDETVLIDSALARSVTEGDIWVNICIYRAETEDTWLLEVEAHKGGSTVWDERFDSDQNALDEAMRTIQEDGIGSFAEAMGS